VACFSLDYYATFIVSIKSWTAGIVLNRFRFAHLRETLVDPV